MIPLSAAHTIAAQLDKIFGYESVRIDDPDLGRVQIYRGEGRDKALRCGCITAFSETVTLPTTPPPSPPYRSYRWYPNEVSIVPHPVSTPMRSGYLYAFDHPDPALMVSVFPAVQRLLMLPWEAWYSSTEAMICLKTFHYPEN